MSSSHSMTPTTSYCWGLKLHYKDRGFFTRWFSSEIDRNKHERSLMSYESKPLWIEKINPELATAPPAQDAQDDMVMVPREPTKEMMIAGDDAIQDGMMKAVIGTSYGLHPDHACWNVYKAMLDAAMRGKGE